jgi:hypothetical protein
MRRERQGTEVRVAVVKVAERGQGVQGVAWVAQWFGLLQRVAMYVEGHDGGL